MSRLVVVSNRVAPIEEGKATAGGLAVGVLDALRKSGGIWFGWNGETVKENGPAKTQTKDNIDYVTIGLTKRDYDHYYRGFSNATLWPIFHYRIDLARYNREEYDGYRRVNMAMAERLKPLLKPDDIIWVHDYHLIPFAEACRMLGIRNRIGFFLHIPFPAPEILTAIPPHNELLKTLCFYDLIGFQTDTDQLAFLDKLPCRYLGVPQPRRLGQLVDQIHHLARLLVLLRGGLHHPKIAQDAPHVVEVGLHLLLAPPALTSALEQYRRDIHCPGIVVRPALCFRGHHVGKIGAQRHFPGNPLLPFVAGGRIVDVGGQALKHLAAVQVDVGVEFGVKLLHEKVRQPLGRAAVGPAGKFPVEIAAIPWDDRGGARLKARPVDRVQNQHRPADFRRSKLRPQPDSRLDADILAAVHTAADKNRFARSLPADERRGDGEIGAWHGKKALAFLARLGAQIAK